MGSMLLVAAVAFIAFLWVRTMRRNRLRWLEQVNLPGSWTADADGEVVNLELKGGYEGGDYVETVGSRTERGTWHVSGGALVFESVGDSSPCEMRVFDDDRIGLDGPGRARRIYQRSQSNVVPLRRERR